MIQSLKNSGRAVARLLPSIRCFARKFAEATGIQVQLKTISQPLVKDCIAADVFHLGTEGFRNIRRPASAETAEIRLAQGNGGVVQIANDYPAGEVFVPFMPRSISEHVTALAGRIHVEPQGHSATVVRIERPV